MHNHGPSITRLLLVVAQLLMTITCVSSWKGTNSGGGRTLFRVGRRRGPTAFRGGAAAAAAATTTSTISTTTNNNHAAAAAAAAVADTNNKVVVDTYWATLESIKSQVLQEIAQPEITKLRQSIIEEGTVIEGFGAKADELCDRAVAAFCDRAPPPPPSSTGTAAATYDAVLADVERSVDAPLQVLYMKQLGYLRELALQQFRTSAAVRNNNNNNVMGGTLPGTGTTTAVGGSSSSTYESMLRADADFVEAAVSSTRSSSNSLTGGSNDQVWDYTQERHYLQAVLNLAAEQASKRYDLVVETAEKQQAAMSVLQYQNQMIQQLQSQLYGQSSPWNIGMAYRIPDTNFNLQGSYQQGRANVQVSCVPDEYAPLLGPNGFTNGVGPGNLGLSLNLSL